MLFLGVIYPIETPASRSGPCGTPSSKIRVDSSSRFLSTMPSKRTSDDTDLVEPTQYQVDPNRKVKEPPPQPLPLPAFNPLHILLITEP